MIVRHMQQSDGRLWLLLILLLVLPATALAQAPLRVGEVRPYRAESPHPYPRAGAEREVVWSETIVSPGATFLRLHFRGFSLAPADWVTVSNPESSESWTYRNAGPKGTGRFWSFAVSGDTAVVEIHGGRRPGHGYVIDAVGHGTVQIGPPAPEPEVVCGTDGREDVACHLTAVDAAQGPVSRLLFVSGAFLYACTGWLIDGSDADMLITNNHCISRQSEVDSLQATFNLQRSTCGGDTDAEISNFAGGVLLKTNNVDRRGNKDGLDYTLLTLIGNPEAIWGELVGSTKQVAVDDLIWFIQHPGGGVKMIGYWEDAEKTVRCAVGAVNRTYGRSAPGSQTAYACDSEGGSSGSPIVDEVTGEVIALHHFGGVEDCLNAGTAMAEICADAGALLNCAGGPADPATPTPTATPDSAEDPTPTPADDPCTLAQLGDPCVSDSDCCSGKCRGKPGEKLCR